MRFGLAGLDMARHALARLGEARLGLVCLERQGLSGVLRWDAARSDEVGRDVVWHDAVWFVWLDEMRFGTIRCDPVRLGKIRFGVVWPIFLY